MESVVSVLVAARIGGQKGWGRTWRCLPQEPVHGAS